MHSQFLWATFFSTSLSSEWKVSYKHQTKISPLLVKTDHAKKSVSLLFVISPQVLKSHNEVCPQPYLLQNEQANLPQTFFITEVLQPYKCPAIWTALWLPSGLTPAAPSPSWAENRGAGRDNPNGTYRGHRGGRQSLPPPCWLLLFWCNPGYIWPSGLLAHVKLFIH